MVSPITPKELILGKTIPVVIIYSFFMDYYLSGMTAGAVKG